MTILKVDVQNEEKVIAALGKFPKQVVKYLNAAGAESAKVIMAERGLKSYPPSTAANRPGRTRTVNINGRPATFRMGYYKRGEGALVPVRGGGYKSLRNSQNLGKQWKVTQLGYGVKIAVGSTYAPYVHGEEQAKAMAGIGWRRLIDVAMLKLGAIKQIYQGWVDKLIADLGL